MLLFASSLSNFSAQASSKDGFPILPQSDRPQLPSFTILDGSGTAFSPSRYFGSILILQFQASHCGPCLKELTFLDRLQGDLKSLPLFVFSISEDSGLIQSAKKLITQQKLSWLRPYADNKGSAAEALNIDGLPTSFIIDKQGRIVAVLQGPQEWDSPSFEARIRFLATQP